MKYRFLLVLLLLASAQADAQFFKKKKKQPADSTAQRPGFRQPEPEVPEFGNQELSIVDLLEIMDRRADSAHIHSKLVKAGFNRHAVADKNQMVHMGDTAKGVTKFTEMVFLQTDGREIQLVQFCTRHAQKFQSIRRDLRSSPQFIGQPTLTEDDELSEGFSTRDYQILLESYQKKTRFVISVWLKGARLK
ncbi:MAG: hypothetical protein EOO16_15080 [Chitinophagaceae bacterium]|nr:MAG: hypothetical protein EOO16_15080 [Chitinophagaceae bacterium]